METRTYRLWNGYTLHAGTLNLEAMNIRSIAGPQDLGNIMQAVLDIDVAYVQGNENILNPLNDPSTQFNVKVNDTWLYELSPISSGPFVALGERITFQEDITSLLRDYNSFAIRHESGLGTWSDTVWSVDLTITYVGTAPAPTLELGALLIAAGAGVLALLFRPAQR